MSTKPRMFFTESRGDVDLDPFQFDALRPLLLEQEMRIKTHFDHRMEQLMRFLEHSDHFDHREAEAKPPRANTFQNVGSGPSPDDQLGLKAGVAPHLLQLIDRVKADNEKNIFNPQASFVSALPLWERGKWKQALEQSLGLYEYAVDLLVMIYAVCLGVEIHHTSMSRSEPTWARTLDTAFCAFFSVDLLIRICMERKRFFTGSRRWWNLVDSLSLSMLLVALLEGSRSLGNFSAMIRVGRIMRLARCLWTFRSALARWTQLRQLRVLLTSMAESFKVMVWLVLLVLIFIYVYGLVLTESIWDSCPNDQTPLVCTKFGDLLSSQMTLYQIIYSGLLWGELWDELQQMAWYVRIVFLSYVVFALMVLVNTITSFICSLQSTVSKRERDVLIDNEIDYNERLVRQLYTIFKDFDQNGNGAISWAEFQLALDDERMHAFLNALELDMSDAVKVFQILASEKTGAIEESDFLLGCLRLRGGATAVDMVRMQMEQEWMHSALLQMKALMHRAIGELATVQQMQQTVERRSLWGESDSRFAQQSHFHRQASAIARQSAQGRRPESKQSSVSSSSDEPIHTYERTNLKTFERAMTLQQLKIIDQELDRWCRGWTDAFTGAAISVATLNLYQFNYHHVLSQTAPPEGVLLQWPASLVKDVPPIGSTVFQRCPQMKLPRASGKVIQVIRTERDSENGMDTLSLCVRLLKGQFSRNIEEVVSMGEFELSAREMTVTARNSISYKELLSPEACLPVWYCSHWWGEPIRSFVDCCQQHAILRRLGDLGSYWVCGYANRQHELDLEIAEDVMHTSFFSALKASRGLLLILDEDATPFSRIWCDYEVYSAVMNPNMELDLAVSLMHSGRQEAKIITKNLVPGESAVAKSAREQDFPIFLLDRGLEVCLEKGNTTQERDRTNIFQAIAQSKELESAEGQERLHRNLNLANQTLHSTLAILAWPQAVHKNLLPKHAKGLQSGKLNVCDALLKDTSRESLDLSLAHFDESCSDSVVKALAESLPPCLVNLKLSFEGCVRITDVSLQALTARLVQLKLKYLHLDFVGCKNLTDAGLRLLATALHKSNLVELELHFAGCVRLHSPGISQLQENLPSSLRSFKGSFKGTAINRNFQNLCDFQEFKVKASPSKNEL